MRVIERGLEYFYKMGIGPDTEKEMRQVHRGIIMGGAKVWTPRGVYRVMRDLARSNPMELEEREAHHFIGWFIATFTVKWLGLYLAAQAYGLNIEQVLNIVAG